MSPTSKSRKKKRGPQRSSHERIDHEPGCVWQPLSWFATSIEAVLDNADTVVGATGPREMEQATCELLGEQLYRAVDEGRSGLWFNWWFEELTVAAAAASGMPTTSVAHGGSSTAWPQWGRPPCDRSRATRSTAC
jgi:hypothetical protein